MGNEDQQNQSTELESDINIEEPPSLEETLKVLDKVFDDNRDGIDAEKLLADAEIYFSEFLQHVQCQMEQYSKSIGSDSIAVTPLEQLDEIDLDFLSAEEELFYLQAEGIDCGLFLERACRSIRSTTGIVV